MARGVAVPAVPAPTPGGSATTHPVALAALSSPGVHTVELTERPDGATQLIVVMAPNPPSLGGYTVYRRDPAAVEPSTRRPASTVRSM